MTTKDRLLTILRKRGPHTTTELAEVAGCSRSQVTNAMHQCGIKKANGVYSVPPSQSTNGLVPPRVINVFATSGLSAKYQISPLGNREGANDHLQIRSKHV